MRCTQLPQPARVVPLDTKLCSGHTCDYDEHFTGRRQGTHVSRVSKHHERVTVTVHGQPSAVLISPDDLAMLEETIAVLGDQDLMMQLAAAEADLAAGRVETQEDLEAAMRSRQTSA